MRNLLYIVLSVLLFISTDISAFSLTKEENNYNRISKVDEGLYFIYFDTTSQKRVITKGTIVEFEDNLVLIEMSINDHRKSSDTLQDHFEECERALASIKAYFPDKPLKYVLSSHWHPHSLASINPIITKGIKVVTTKLNFERLKEFVDSATFNKYRDNFIFVEDDNFILKDERNEIRVFKINKDEYTSLPTSDFLFFHIPKYGSLHVSCMFQRLTKAVVMGNEFISTRTEDVVNFMTSNNIVPKNFISIDPYADEPNGLILADTLNRMLKNGILPSTIEKYLYDLPDGNLLAKSDSLMKYFMANLIPPYLINKTIYKLLERHEIAKALELAKFNSVLFPSNPNSWDTLAEVYYFNGDNVLAKKYASECKRINSSFESGNETKWQENLNKYKEKWEKSLSK